MQPSPQRVPPTLMFYVSVQSISVNMSRRAVVLAQIWEPAGPLVTLHRCVLSSAFQARAPRSWAADLGASKFRHRQCVGKHTAKMHHFRAFDLSCITTSTGIDYEPTLRKL